MKIKVGDSGSAYAAVYLDGEFVPYCIAADDERGYADYHAIYDGLDGGGGIVVVGAPLRVLVHRRFGVVEIRRMPS